MRGALAALLLLCTAAAHAEPSVVGEYDGTEPEIAAALELTGNGHFRYVLSYGALDERAEGRWTQEQDTVFLTTEPKVMPPRFVLASDTPVPAGKLRVRLSDPDALGGFPLTLIVTLAGADRPQYIDAEEDGSVPLEPGAVVTSIVPDLPVYDIPYQPHALTPGAGHDLVFRFELNDLGKADFQREPVVVAKDGLHLERHGRLIRFRRM